MSITTKQSDDQKSLTISIAGTLNFSKAELFRESYEKVIPRPVNFVVDLQQADSVDIAALNMILDLKDYSGNGAKSVKIINCNALIKKTFAITKLDREVTI